MRLGGVTIAGAALLLVGGAAPADSETHTRALIPIVPGTPAPAPTPPPPPSPAQDAGKTEKPKVVTKTLSDEFKKSRWAYVARTSWARRSPRSRGKHVKRLHVETEDKTPELVLVLDRRTNTNGSVWYRVRLPMRPNNTTGWVPKRSLSEIHTVRTALRIDRAHQRAVLYRKGRPIWRARIGVGRRKWPTPPGNFYVREFLLPAEANSIYGIFAFGTSAYSSVLTDWPGGGVVGIHGTNEPELIPGRISHGCIRIRNRNVRKLKRLMKLGTPIRIR